MTGEAVDSELFVSTMLSLSFNFVEFSNEQVKYDSW